jgi:hypothetical protein
MTMHAAGTEQPAQAHVLPSQLLTMTLGFMDMNRMYSADAADWAKALLKVRDEFERKYPDLFERFTYRQAPDTKPYSRDVSEFLTYVQWGRNVRVGNPDYAVLQIKPEVQRDLLDPYRDNPRYALALQAAKDLATALQDGHLVDASLS